MAASSVPSSAPPAGVSPALPFVCKLSLEPLLRAWGDGDGVHPVFARFAADVRRLAAEHRALFEPTEDLSCFRDAEDLVKLLLAPVLSCASGQYNLTAVARPFHYDILYATRGFRELLLDADGALRARPRKTPAQTVDGRLRAIYVQIARLCYGIDLAFSANPTFVVNEDGLNRYFQFHYDPQYLDVARRGAPATLSDEQADALRRNPRDLELWQKLLPPEQFELRGAMLIHAVDITDRESISNVQQAFTAGTPLVSPSGLKLLTQSARDVFRRPDLSIRLLYAQHGTAFMVSHDAHGCDNCLISNSRRFGYEDFAGSVYERAKKGAADSVVFIKDARAELDPGNVLHRVLLDDGVRSLMVIPLRDEGNIIGVMELDFRGGDIDAGDVALRIADLQAITTLGLKQAGTLLESNVRNLIQKKTSVVHPAVEWKFRRAAFDAIVGESDGFAGVSFDDVYPLYSQADIKDSSRFRNRAIQQDLSAQLRLARAVLIDAQKRRDMPLLAELDFQIETHLNSLDDGLSSGEELAVKQFFHDELEPVLPRLAELGGDVRLAIENYRSRLDPRYGALYEKRAEYEQSVRAINDAIAGLLADEEPRAQQAVPFYLEKTFTDGAEMMLYAGASLTEDGRFDPFYLRNLRLWQLRLSCRIARLAGTLGPALPVPLELTHLVLVQDAPLSISFSETERDFVVDGAYNIRYEIMKKRIDKATVNGGDERLTQPGRIAIVYANDSEAQEYRRFIRFLQHQGWLADEVEELELEVLQGLNGLRALRVAVLPAADGADANGVAAALVAPVAG